MLKSGFSYATFETPNHGLILQFELHVDVHYQ
jgi:hypothetical protein